MSRAPAFQFYAADYLADEHVQMMTLEQEGAYIRLLAYCWREGSIPADLSMLSRLCKEAPAESLQLVTARFEPHPERPDRLVHPRLELERDKQSEWRRKSVEGGRASAKKRKQTKGGARVVEPKPNQRATGPVEPKGNTSSAFSSSSSSATALGPNHIDHTHKQQKPVCVLSKFSLDQIRQYAWASYHLDERLRARGQKQVDGIRNPDGWAVAAHRSGECDELIQEWLDHPGKFELAS